MTGGFGMFHSMVLSLDDAKRIAAAARAEAERNGWAVVIAVVDDGGHLMYLERMDGTQKASSGIAELLIRWLPRRLAARFAPPDGSGYGPRCRICACRRPAWHRGK